MLPVVRVFVRKRLSLFTYACFDGAIETIQKFALPDSSGNHITH